MQLSEYRLRRHMSKWTSIYSEPLLNFGIRPIVVSLLEKWTWRLPWRSIRLCFGVQRFKSTRLILELDCEI
ncbi:hypothetical protein Goshw_006123 [Gossypium schwendimanii]|uniref:Uncharacterized protein n=1 Tax=Gossypium schwendimanii TaxID=34291 RepID=A0A7J9MRM8_GOSSC|nr:hypothetical protein [Gossypium schwendimanii]